MCIYVYTPMWGNNASIHYYTCVYNIGGIGHVFMGFFFFFTTKN